MLVDVEVFRRRRSCTQQRCRGVPAVSRLHSARGFAPVIHIICYNTAFSLCMSVGRPSFRDHVTKHSLPRSAKKNNGLQFSLDTYWSEILAKPLGYVRLAPTAESCSSIVNMKLSYCLENKASAWCFRLVIIMLLSGIWLFEFSYTLHVGFSANVYMATDACESTRMAPTVNWRRARVNCTTSPNKPYTATN